MLKTVMLGRLDPTRFVLAPAVLALVLFVVAAATRVLVLLIPCGVIVFVIGLRIAYDHRRAGERYMRVMGWQVPWFPALKPETKRTIDGSVIAALGVMLTGVAVNALLR
jgi:hypothetical protein